MKPITPNYNDMTSSTGFKKRNLIRPPSTMGLTQKEYLKSLDISQTQSTIASVLKNDITTIQEQINILDMDKKLRYGQIGLGKNSTSVLRKWLKQSQLNFQKEDDELKILKFMNVDNLSAGFKKLWRLTGLLDNILTKSTQLQVITFLKYDQLFLSICKDYTPVTKKLNNINQSFSIGGFQATQIIIQRMQDLFSIVSRMRKTEKSSSSLSIANQTDQLINKLQSQNAKLNEYLSKLTDQLQKTPRINSKQQNQQAKVQKNVLDRVFNQVTQKYKTQLQETNSKLQYLLNQQAKLKIQIQVLKRREQMLANDVKDLQNSKMNRRSSNSYEQALMQELQSMKMGYEAKIGKLINEFTNKQKELRRKQNQYRIENQKVKFQRSLLLKKYDMMK